MQSEQSGEQSGEQSIKEVLKKKENYITYMAKKSLKIGGYNE